VETNFEKLLTAITAASRSNDQILVMSNGGFGNIHARLLQTLA
jgi:UDP-N-acetylmuramate: L-alanyl-gamma-D-glutamyl-meso-diaminopimelate ligase